MRRANAMAGKDLVELSQDQRRRPGAASRSRVSDGMIDAGVLGDASDWGRATVPGTRSVCRALCARADASSRSASVAADDDAARGPARACRRARASASICRRRCGRRGRRIRRRRPRNRRRPSARTAPKCFSTPSRSTMSCAPQPSAMVIEPMRRASARPVDLLHVGLDRRDGVRLGVFVAGDAALLDVRQRGSRNRPG